MLRIFLTFTCIILVIFSVLGQVTDYSGYLNGTIPLSDISTLKTANDVSQTSMSINEIDDKIESIIRKDADENYSLDLPINSKALRYIGKKHIKDVLTFSQDAFNSRLKFIDREIEIYTYDSIYILIPSKDAKSLLNLFFTARALTIIKFRYPQAYFGLIKQTQNTDAASFVLPVPFRKIAAFNKSITIISFDTSPTDIAASTADNILGNSVTIGGLNYFQNTNILVTSIDQETIYGANENSGSKPIYKLKSANDNYFHYMRDGLLETLMHEFVHHYITNSVAIDEKSSFINQMRSDTTDINFDVDVEEAIVLNTIQRYYKRIGGVSKKIVAFYGNKYEAKKEKLIKAWEFGDKINLQRFYALKALTSGLPIKFEDIYYLKILEE